MVNWYWLALHLKNPNLHRLKNPRMRKLSTACQRVLTLITTANNRQKGYGRRRILCCSPQLGFTEHINVRDDRVVGQITVPAQVYPLSFCTRLVLGRKRNGLKWDRQVVLYCCKFFKKRIDVVD